jgi:hypothetical protein
MLPWDVQRAPPSRINASPILTENARYGPAWLTPTGILDARLAKFGAKFTF